LLFLDDRARLPNECVPKPSCRPRIIIYWTEGSNISNFKFSKQGVLVGPCNSSDCEVCEEPPTLTEVSPSSVLLRCSMFNLQVTHYRHCNNIMFLVLGEGRHHCFVILCLHHSLYLSVISSSPDLFLKSNSKNKTKLINS
jgi:hypothetical protein